MVAGLLLRLFFFAASLLTEGAPLIRDEGNYVGIAVPLSQGQGFVEKWVWIRPPAYPLFVAAFLVASGGELPAAALAQIVLSVLNIGLLYALVLELFAWRGNVSTDRVRAVGLAAAALMALNPHAVFYANLLMPETLYMLAITVVGWALVRALHLWGTSKALWLVALAGATAAVGVLLRSLLLTFVPLLVAWLVWVAPRPRGVQGGGFRLSRAVLLPAALFLAVMAAVIAPWTARNYVRYGRFLPVDTVGQYQLWLYNDNLGVEEIKQRLDAIPNAADRGSYAMERGLSAILADLPAFGKEAAGRFTAAWPVDYFAEFRLFVRDKYPGTDCTNLDIFAWAGTLFYMGFGLLTIWGLALAPGRAFKGLFLLMLLHYGVTTMFAHAEFRYRMPLYPFASLYAGWALVSLFGWARVRRSTPSRAYSALRVPHSALIAALLSLLFVGQSVAYALPGLPNSIRYERRYLAGKSALAGGDYAGALASFTGAAQIDGACGCLYRNIGLAHGGLGQRDQERAAYEAAIAREEHEWRARALLSDRLRAAGDLNAARPVVLTRPEFRDVQQRWAWENLPPPRLPAIDVGGADIGYLAGFETSEAEPLPGGGEVSYRWSGPRARLRLPPPEGQGPLRLVLRWHSLAWPGKPDPDGEVRVLVNGRDAGTLTARPGWEEVTLDLPEVGQPGTVVIELLTAVARPPGGETRLLGVAIDEVRLERVVGSR